MDTIQVLLCCAATLLILLMLQAGAIVWSAAACCFAAGVRMHRGRPQARDIAVMGLELQHSIILTLLLILDCAAVPAVSDGHAADNQSITHSIKISSLCPAQDKPQVIVY